MITGGTARILSSSKFFVLYYTIITKTVICILYYKSLFILPQSWKSYQLTPTPYPSSQDSQILFLSLLKSILIKSPEKPSFLTHSTNNNGTKAVCQALSGVLEGLHETVPMLKWFTGNKSGLKLWSLADLSISPCCQSSISSLHTSCLRLSPKTLQKFCFLVEMKKCSRMMGQLWWAALWAYFILTEGPLVLLKSHPLLRLLLCLLGTDLIFKANGPCAGSHLWIRANRLFPTRSVQKSWRNVPTVFGSIAFCEWGLDIH